MNGLNFKSIAELTKIAITNNFLEYIDKKIDVSDKGKQKIVDLDKKYKLINKESWIRPENESKICKLDKDFIFLPNQNELHF